MKIPKRRWTVVIIGLIAVWAAVGATFAASVFFDREITGSLAVLLSGDLPIEVF